MNVVLGAGDDIKKARGDNKECEEQFEDFNAFGKARSGDQSYFFNKESMDSILVFSMGPILPQKKDLYYGERQKKPTSLLADFLRRDGLLRTASPSCRWDKLRDWLLT